MELLPVRKSPETWIAEIFSPRSVPRGGVVQRSVRWVDRETGRDRLIADVRARGFHMIECGGQFVVICNTRGLRVVC